jgi:hypothetical protein
MMSLGKMGVYKSAAIVFGNTNNVHLAIGGFQGAHDVGQPQTGSRGSAIRDFRVKYGVMRT